MLTVMARILAAKPHSADVERCISANNLLKTSLRATLTILTENAYLFIHHNLPPTATWDPKPSVLQWMSKPHRQRQCSKAKQQPHFRHVFDEAQRQQTCGENTTKRMSTPGSASQTAQQLDPAADAMSESEDDEEAEQEAESSTQSTEIENDEEQTADNSVSSARHF